MVSLTETVQELQQRLLAARDGGAAYDAFEALAKKLKSGERSAQQFLVDYARAGKYDHVRGFICGNLAEQASAGDPLLLPFFMEGLRDPVRGYWSILGYLRVAGRESYGLLSDVALDSSVHLDQRAHAIKCLAGHSGQRFERGAPPDPGHWSAKHLRVVEIRSWKEAGYPLGAGYDKPSRHPALTTP